MKVKCKKMLSATVVSAIVAAQALMPVAAAGGSIDADMSTKSPILRVQVPTKMAVAVNEFEMGDEGSQVTSGVFDMKNLSEIPVNVKVSSEAEVGASTTLVSTKKAVESEDSAMWLAAVAAINESGGAFEYTSEGDKAVKDLTGEEGNITAFGTKDASNKSTAVQNFYLQAAASATYEGITGDEVDAEKAAATATIGGADFYELTVLTNTTDDAAGAETLAADKDIYITDEAAATGTVADFTKIEKGTEAASITWTATKTKAYSIADAPTDRASLDNTKTYLYINGATSAAGDAAAFRYIGALSEGKAGWSTSDLKNIKITYDIIGISTSVYEDIAADDGLTYGYKAENSAITLTGDVMRINVKPADFKDGTLKLGDTTAALASSAGTWGSDGEDVTTFTFSSTWAEAIKGKTIEVTVNLKDGTSLTATFNVPN